MSEIRKILSTEFSEEFIQHMRNRMVMSFYKYGFLRDAYPDKVNALQSLLDRLDKYKETGNKEFLVDAANFAMIEYMHPKHGTHFRGTDSTESPGRRTSRGKVDHRDNNTVGTNPRSKLSQFR